MTLITLRDGSTVNVEITITAIEVSAEEMEATRLFLKLASDRPRKASSRKPKRIPTKRRSFRPRPRSV